MDALEGGEKEEKDVTPGISKGRWARTITLSLLVAAACAPAGDFEASIEGSALSPEASTTHIAVFLPPLGEEASTEREFETGLDPRVRICEGTTACDHVVAEFTQDGSGAERLRVDDDGRFIVNWSVRRSPVEVGRSYRVHVLLDDTSIGWRDVFVSDPGSRAQADDGLFAIGPNRTLPIKFGIESAQRIHQISFHARLADWHDIYVVNSDGSGFEMVSRNRDGQNYDPAWSPDGRWLAYSQGISGVGSHIWLKDFETREGFAVHHSLSSLRRPAWSPDGRRIAFQAVVWYGPGWHWQILEVDVETLELRHLTGEVGYDHQGPVYAPDGSRLAFHRVPVGGHPEIRILDFGTGQTVTAGEGSWVGYQPSWTRDGEWVVYYAFYGDNRIRMGRYDGTANVAVREAVGDRRPEAAPRSDRIAFRRRLSLFERAVSILDLQTDEVVDVAGPMVLYAENTWCPDETCIAFVGHPMEDDESERALWIVDLDGSEPRRLTDGGANYGHLSVRP